MKKGLFLGLVFLLTACSASFLGKKHYSKPTDADRLRTIYFGPKSQWPAAMVDSGIRWQELDIVPNSPLLPLSDSLAAIADLGKTLFFDPRLSSSNKISCASCHLPNKSWTDGRVKSIGHNQLQNKRNAPTILNVWFYKKLFWDGRSHSLADQAFSPINSESEMASEMPDLIRKLRRIKGYTALFDHAFKNEGLNPETLTMALEVFQKTIVSKKAAFDSFLLGNKFALSNEALRGLHIFRTKAGCMNCHYGNLLSDNSFHNLGIFNEPNETKDEGRYFITKQETDKYKFKTPSLRDVVFTGPWLHDGSRPTLAGLIHELNAGAPQATLNNKPIRPLKLTPKEEKDLLAFLYSLSATPDSFLLPTMPQ